MDLIKRQKNRQTRQEGLRAQESFGPKEWTEQMTALAGNLSRVKWKKHNIIVVNSTKVHNRMNEFRALIEDMPSDIIALIPSARWLFDNFQMVYREIKRLNASMTGFAAMPVLKGREGRGLPRMYVIARKMVEASGGYLNEENIILMIKAYQEVQPLTNRELHVMPEMIGLAVLEHVLDVTREIISVAELKARADRFVKENYNAEHDYPDIAPLIKPVPESETDIYFHSHVLYLLKNLSAEQQAIQRYIAFHFEDEGQNIASVDIFKEESRQESILESAIRNPVASLKELNELNEETLFEELSLVEGILSKDPAGVYPRMDAGSRGMYRLVIERLSKKHAYQETDVAETCLNLAQRGHPRLTNPHHVGVYLVGKGKGLLKEKLLKGKTAGIVKEKKNVKGLAYFLSGGLLLALMAFLVFFALQKEGYGGQAAHVSLYLLAALPLLVGLAVKITNYVFSRSVPAKELPAMDYTESIPESAAAYVIMPVIISKEKQGINYLNRLEKHFLANRQDNLHFALLADYADAPAKEMPEDEGIRRALTDRLAVLNAQYPSQLPKFSLFIRERRWNESEDSFMCWERKRGKLEEFNRLLNEEPVENTSFEIVLAAPELWGNIRYVITLDADSDLVLGNAAKMVGIIDHPLNRAIVDMKSGTVKEGYAIIQPQVMNHISLGNSSFEKVYSGRTGLPNYSMAVSDVYQDVFEQGTFVGKGIYNAKVFHTLLNGVIPENRVLSHDLLESCIARTAFAGNAFIVESFPGSYASYVKRQHRWIRGDWQLLPWLFGRKLSFLSKWKIVDDLRASLMPVAKLAVLFINLLLFPHAWWVWAGLMAVPLVIDFGTLLLNIVVHLAQKQRYVLLYRKLLSEIIVQICRFVLDLVLIPYEAYYSMDAVLRTLYRYLISKKRFLMWEAFEHAEKAAANSFGLYLGRMWPTVIPAGLLAWVIFITPLPLLAILLYALLALSWAMSSFIAYWISRPNDKHKTREELDPVNLLQDTGRKIWRFFRDFSTEDSNYLLPDNFQLGRREKLTHKTSPTNIGLQFLAALSARDMGYETLTSTLEYITSLLHTVQSLPRWNGHLYNWYDTRTLDMLHPRYVSTVDSGNYIGYIIALRGGLKELRDAPVMSPALPEELNKLLHNIDAGVSLTCDYALVGDFVKDVAAARGNLAKQSTYRSSRDMSDFIRLADLVEHDATALDLNDRPYGDKATLHDLAADGNSRARDLLEKIKWMTDSLRAEIREADFGKLFNPRRKLFTIGFNAGEQTHDKSCYDLIASEAVLTSVLAIAKGDVPVRHWQRLGRPLTIISGIPAHVSWSGTMFEYLMPQLVLREFKGSVFEDSSRAAVLQQMKYAEQHEVPWGISESQYYRFDINQNYQYKAFGVPKLRLQSVYRDMLVITPYASFLALDYGGDKVLANLTRILDMGGMGEYGFYEAIDFTVPDPVTLEDYCIVRSFMAHHQGMSLVAINNYLNNGIMRRRFHETPMIKAAEALVEETHQGVFATPSRRGYTINLKPKELPRDESIALRYVKNVGLTIPSSNYISNGDYSLMITSDGDGFSTWMDKMLYRWRPDVYADTGYYIYVRDVQDNQYWSAAYNPTRKKPDHYQVVFSPHQSAFSRRDGEVATEMVVTIGPNYPLEFRKITLRNISNRAKTLEVTSYMEVTMDTLDAEASHPAFNKLFIESEYLDDRRAFIAKRRDGVEEGPYALSMLHTDAPLARPVEYENNRLKFIGRNNALSNPQAVSQGMPLSGSTAFSGDPVLCIRAAVTLAPGEVAELTFMGGMFHTREELLHAVDDYAYSYRMRDAAETFRQQSQIELKYLDMTGTQHRAFQNIIRQIYYPSRFLRGPSENIRRNWGGQSSLWKFGISGDNPIMLVIVASETETKLMRDVLKIYEYMGINRVKTDLVILAQSKYGYANDVVDMINTATSSLRLYDSPRERSGIYIIRSYELSPAETDLLFTVAGVVFTGETGIYFRRNTAR